MSYIDLDHDYIGPQKRKEMRATIRRINKECAANARLPSPLKPGDILFAVMGLQQTNGGRKTLDRVWYFQVTETSDDLGRETVMRRLVDRRERMDAANEQMFSIPHDLTFPRVGVSWPDPGNFRDLPPVAGKADHLGAVSFCPGGAPPVRCAGPLSFVGSGSTRIYQQTPYCDGYPTAREQRHNPDWRNTGIVNQPPPLAPDPSYDPWGYLDAYLGL